MSLSWRSPPTKSTPRFPHRWLACCFPSQWQKTPLLQSVANWPWSEHRQERLRPHRQLPLPSHLQLLFLQLRSLRLQHLHPLQFPMPTSRHLFVVSQRKTTSTSPPLLAPESAAASARATYSLPLAFQPLLLHLPLQSLPPQSLPPLPPHRLLLHLFLPQHLQQLLLLCVAAPSR